MVKKSLLVIAVILIIIQFIRPGKNLTDDRTKDISNNYPVPGTVNSLLQRACNDCHSNKTNYPWYAEVQPLGWWINYHITDGKKELNFSTFTGRPIAVQNHKFEEVIEMVEEKKMPLHSYTWFGMHHDAELSDEEREIIMGWARGQMNSLKMKYPADSLILKRKVAPAVK